jgi:hypothetical protein
LLDGAIRDIGSAAQREREQRLIALRREIDDTARTIKNLVRNFSRIDKPTDDLVRDINEERSELHKRKSQLEEQPSLNLRRRTGRRSTPISSMLYPWVRSRLKSYPKTSLDSSLKPSGSNCTTTRTPTGSGVRPRWSGRRSLCAPSCSRGDCLCRSTERSGLKSTNRT